jgi:hypothetical protein
VTYGNSLERRAGERRKFEVELIDGLVFTLLIILARGYPGSSHLHDAQRGANAVPASNNAFRYDRPIVYTVNVHILPSHEVPVSFPTLLTIIQRPQTGSCAATNVEIVDRTTLTRQELIDGWDTEHNPDVRNSENSSNHPT